MRTSLVLTLLISVSARLGSSQSLKVPPPLPPDARYKADVLLVVAHPDDDTTIGGYLARLADQKRRVAVIYCTPGDGGGNNVGNESGRSLGQVRMLEARRALASLGIENVWFMGASDTPGQNVLWSLDHWQHGRVLEDVVRLVRLTRPEVILTWLPESVAGENHADHQAAGVIATEAFDIAADRTQFAEQLSPARDRTGMMNYTEGLLPWQPQKIYYFTDAFDNFIPYWHDRKDLSPFRKNFLDGQGPSYSTTEVSPSKHKTYAELAAEELSFFGTQSADLGQNALRTNNFEIFNFPVRFIFGKSLVGGSVTGDIFEKITPEPIHFVPAPGYRPDTPKGLTVTLGDPWLFYHQFWKAHNLEHLADLLPIPETSVPLGGTLNIPIVVENGTEETQEITFEPVLPKGWTDLSKYRRVDVAPGGSAILPVVLQAAERGAREWQELHWSATAGGKPVGQATLRVYFGKGSGLPQ